MAQPFIHESAYIDDGAELEEDVKVWHFCHVRSGARLGRGVSLARDVYVDADVQIGEGSRIQNGVSLYKGVTIEPWSFVGPHVIFTNDRFPRAGNRHWKITETRLLWGCAIGAGAVIRCGITLGRFSMVGAGAIVTESVPDFHLVVGFPAVTVKRICACGQTQLDLDGASRVDSSVTDKTHPLVLDCCRENLDPRALSGFSNYLPEVDLTKSRG